MAASLVGPTLSVLWTNDETIGCVRLAGDRRPGLPILLPPARSEGIWRMPLRMQLGSIPSDSQMVTNAKGPSALRSKIHAWASANLRRSAGFRASAYAWKQ